MTKLDDEGMKKLQDVIDGKAPYPGFIVITFDENGPQVTSNVPFGQSMEVLHYIISRAIGEEPLGPVQ